MTAYDVFPDAEAAARAMIRATLTTARVYSSIPKNPEYPLVVLQRTGGTPVTRQRLDAADIQVDVWGKSKSEARLLAAQVRQALHAGANVTYDIPSGDAFVTGVEDILGLQWLPDATNTQKDRYVFAVRVFLHAA
jgi:hypothetical protein